MKNVLLVLFFLLLGNYQLLAMKQVFDFENYATSEIVSAINRRLKGTPVSLQVINFGIDNHVEKKNVIACLASEAQNLAIHLLVALSK